MAGFSRSRDLELRCFCDRFEVPPRQRKLLLEQKSKAEHIATEMLHRPLLKPSEIYWLLRDMDNEGLLCLMVIARKKHIQQAVSRYVTNLRDTRSLISGQDLLELGFQPGAVFRMVLNQVLEAQLNGEISSRQEALALVQRQNQEEM